ncbi:hypothetical protein TL16_g06712 [Triparma laevis f. inornata]|uniref:FAM13A-like domain-containing protein n=1 Tax=Triparma laevis f. inornata TaxID=1714386 RepID=A0A9W7AUE3_9STRA|nr:hypothetical protein TL16_g06712 [Triparma laevis f. inornata]
MPIIANLNPTPIILHILQHLLTLTDLITPLLSSEEPDNSHSSPNSPQPPLPFGRRTLPFFDTSTSLHSSLSRSLIKSLYETYYPNNVYDPKISYLPPLPSLNNLTDSEPGLIAAILIESLSICPKESVGGFGECYGELIEWGNRLLGGVEPVESVRGIEECVVGFVEEDGVEVLKSLQALRSLTSSDRLSFRFIERLAPHLLRPPSNVTTVLWSVAHQNDMRAAVVVVEVLMDNVNVFFREGWKERGTKIREERKRRGPTQGEEKNDETQDQLNASIEISPNSPNTSYTSNSSPNPTPSSPSNHPAHTSHHHPYSASANALDAQSMQLLDLLCKKSLRNVLMSRPPSGEEGIGKTERDPAHESTSPPPPTRLTPFQRRGYITACRTLRSQISQFENHWMSVHDRKPGQADRGSMASCYSQYGSWKRCIRNDSICRIQGVARGWLCRKMSTRNSTSTEDVRSRLEDMEVDPKSPTRPESNMDEKENDTPLHSHLVSPTIKTLQEKKRDLKQKLKNFDLQFQSQNGRMPYKSEKEPIRHLYEQYNATKEALQKATPSAQKPALTHSTPHQLKLEKAHLHQKLRAYEKEFVQNQGRQVSSFNDIKPVAGLYRRYKELKKALK